jgi:hypothetical protein
MEEALTTLRTAISTALQDDPPDIETSSDPSNISSLSGSLTRKQPRSKLDEERRWMEIALNVERALSDLEGVFHPSISLEDYGDLIDLLVAVMTSVPNALLRKLYKHCSGEGRHKYISSIEEICFHAACISSDLIVKYLLNGDGFCGLGESHAEELVEQITTLLDAEHGMGIDCLYPIIQLLNAVTEQRHMERSFVERGYVGQDFEYHDPPRLFHMSAKDTLRLIRISLRFMDNAVNSMYSSHVGLFTSHLLDHFSEMTLIETGHTSCEECDLFRTWADGMNEHMTRRLTDNDAAAVLNLISKFQIDSIQSALELIDRADVMIASLLSNDEMDGGKEDRVGDAIAAVHDGIRHVTMSVSVTEVMEKLGLEFDPEIHLIFHPLIVNFATFVAAGLQEALVSQHELLGHESQGLSYLVDDLLVRICRTSIGNDFLKHCDDDRCDEVLTIATLRALNSGCIAGKGKFLLDIVADRAQTEEPRPNNEPLAKRHCYIGNFNCKGSYALHSSRRTNTADSTTSKRDMTDLMILCMTLSQSDIDEGIDRSSMDQISCIASSLMPQVEKQQVLDPLNPWHSLNINPLKELMSRLETSQGEPATDAIVSYSLAVPSCFATRGSQTFSE